MPKVLCVFLFFLSTSYVANEDCVTGLLEEDKAVAGDADVLLVETDIADDKIGDTDELKPTVSRGDQRKNKLFMYTYTYLLYSWNAMKLY